MAEIDGLKGLTAQDRAAWEKQFEAKIKGLPKDKIDNAYYNYKYKENFGDEGYEDFKSLPTEKRGEYLSTKLNPKIEIEPLDTRSEDDKKVDSIGQAFQQGQQFKEESTKLVENFNKWPSRGRKALDEFDKIADTISPYYKKYKNTEYLPFSDEEKYEIAAQYQAAKTAFGEDEANKILRRKMQNTASENQSIGEKFWNGFVGMGAQTAGALIGAAGMVKGAIDYIGDERNENLDNSVLDFMDHVVDNKWTRFSNDIMQYGSIFQAGIEEAKKTGLSNTQVIRTTEEEEGSILDNILSVNTIPELINQQGFTIASMLTGAGLSAIADKAFKGLKGLTIAANRAGTLSNLEKTNKVLKGLQQLQQKTNAFIIPAAVGTVEGVTEGLNTKIQFLDDAKKQIAETQSKAVNDKFNELLQNPEELSRLGYNPQSKEDIDRLYKDVFDSYAPRYAESVKKAEANAAKAGVYNMGLNSAINGALNMTLKAGLQTPSVQESLKRSRLGRILSPSEFKVSSSGKVTPSYGKLGQITNVLQEPAGEFTEEYLQSVTDAFARGGAEYNLQNYLNNKYKGDGKTAVDESIANDLFAAGKAAGDALTDKQTILSGIYGALSSGMGTPTINNRRGPAIKRENESSLQYNLRRSPITYRNPIWEAIQEQKELGEERASTAQILTDWIQDPANKSKYDGLVGTFNWAKAMEESSGNNDEFGYRNSELGKTINDVMMLQKIQGSDYYNSFITDLTKAANIEEGTPEAQALIEQFKSAPSNRDIQQDDSSILSTIKKNSNKLLDTMNKISEESTSIDKMLGNAADEDTKQALIYGKLSIDDWRERATKLEDEINQVSINPTTSSNIDESQKRTIINYGTASNIQAEHNKLSKKLDSLKEDVANIENRKSLKADEESVLKRKKAAIKVLEKEVNSIDTSIKSIEGNPILSENDIMHLNPDDRATILNPDNKSKYSKEQQDIIDNVIREGTAIYNDFTDKIQDAGRINIAQKAYLTQYNSILSDPSSFNAFANRIKQQVANDNTRKKYQNLNEIEDYSTFVKSLDTAYRESSVTERHIIRNILKDNPNYNKYIADNKALEGMFDQLDTNDKFNELTENDRTLLMTSMQFLTDKGISPTDKEQAINALSSIDESGNLEFNKYIEEINGRLPDGQRLESADISEIIKTYLDVVNEEEKNTATVEAINKPVEVAPTSTEDSKPPIPISNIFDEIDKNPEAFKPINTEEEPPTKKDITVDNSIPPTKTSTSSDNSIEDIIVDKYKTNSNDEVAKSINNSLSDIDKASSIYNDVKKQAIKVLDELGDSEYETTEVLRETIITKANQLQAQSTEGGDSFERTASLLKQVAAKLKTEPKTQDTKKESIKESIVDNTTEQRRNNSMITTADVDKHPTSVVGKASNDFRIADFLRKGTITPKTPISFIADPAIIEGVKQEMGDIYNEEDHLPIMAVVEDSNGSIILGDKHYQPIGFMPRNSANTQGAARMNPIRNLALKQQDGQLIKDESGNIIATNGYVRAMPPEHTKAGTPNTLIHTIMNNDMNEEDRSKMNNPNLAIEERRNIYNKAKHSILSKIKRISKDNKGERIHLSYVTSNLKGGETEFELYVTTPQNSLTRTGKPIAQVLIEGTADEVLQANSRLYSYGKTLENFFKKKPFSNEFRFKREGNKLVPIGEAATKIRTLEENLGKRLSNYLAIPKNYEYKLTPTEEVNNDSRNYELSVTDGTNNIPLGILSNSSTSTETQATIIENLMLNDNGFRYEGNQPFVKWQVNYNDFSSKEGESEDNRKARLRNINDIFDDNILESSRTSLKYSIKGVDINSPFKQDGSRTPNVKSLTVANPTNATQGKPINTPVITATDQVNTGDAIVDSESGVILEGEVKAEPTSLDKAKTIADIIVKDSKNIRLAGDNSGYIDNNGVKYARVTSIIQADEASTGRFDSNSPWVVPSTNIGTGVDEMVRDFFAGNYKESYPNVSKEYRDSFGLQLEGLKNYLKAQGWTIIPRDIVATGSIKVTDSQGKEHTIPVAGTLDLLAYDSQGNFHILDMKTFRSDINSDKKKKYAKQLSLYKKFIEEKYGIKVASLNIIPIKVSYPSPIGKDKVNYEIKEGNQLIVDGLEYLDANPILKEVGTIPVTDVNIQYDKLSDSEKSMIKEELPAEVKPKSIEVEDNENKVNKNIGLKMGKVKNRFGKKAKGTIITPSENNWNSLTSEQQDAMSKIGYTKEKWDNMTEEEKKHQKDCL